MRYNMHVAFPPEYHPRPVDTSRIALEPSLLKLVEYLARNTHEVWAVERLKGGWTWGPARNDAAKHHPSLVPYELLSESEKQLDRETAMEALKLITALGYQIQPPDTPSTFLTAGSAETASGAPGMQLSDLIATWRAWGQDRCRGEPAAYGAVAQRALDLGEYLLAYDVLKAGLGFFPSDVPLRRLQALALARSGAVEPARSILEQLRREGQGADPETMGLLARCYKDLWEQADDNQAGRGWLSLACESYESAAALRPAGAERHWETINAATLAECLGHHERARAHAAAARDECLQILETGATTHPDAYWPLATLGEAWMVLGDVERAISYYQAAARSGSKLYGRVSSTRRNVRLLLRHRGCDPVSLDEMLSKCLRLPRVAVFSGHMIDQPNRPVPRFPSIIEKAVAGEIRRRLDALDSGIGFASASCGADILFLEAVLERGGEANVILPYGIERFIRESVSIIPGSNWEQRFRDVLSSNNVRVVIASHDPLHDDQIANEYANRLTFGLAGIRAWQLGAELAPLAVWDGMPGDGPGGTCDAVARWRQCGLEPSIINPLETLRRQMPGSTAAVAPVPAVTPVVDAAPQPLPAAPIPSTGGLDRQLVAILFADATGFSKLGEDEVPLFVRHVLGQVAELARSPGREPLHVSTWGDGLYLVFASLTGAAQFALELRDRMGHTDWRALGFRKNVELRTALHVGPVYVCTNPVTGQRDYVGTHVSRTARLEPVTPAGQVYASEAFAALAFAERAAGFRCDYVGQIGMAKDYGAYPTYHVVRRGTAAMPIPDGTGEPLVGERVKSEG